MSIDMNLSINWWNYYNGNQYHYSLTLKHLKVLYSKKKKMKNQMLVT